MKTEPFHTFTSAEVVDGNNNKIILDVNNTRLVAAYPTNRGTKLEVLICDRPTYFTVKETVDDVSMIFRGFEKVPTEKRLTNAQYTPGEKHAYAAGPNSVNGACFFCGNHMGHILHDLSGSQTSQTSNKS